MIIGPCPIVVYNPPAFIQAPPTENNTSKSIGVFAVVAASPVTYFLSKEEQRVTSMTVLHSNDTKFSRPEQYTTILRRNNDGS